MSRNLHPPVDKHRHCNNSLSNPPTRPAPTPIPGTQNIPTAIFLPFIAALTSATCGGIICHFSHAPLQLQVPAIVAYLQVGAGVALATYFNCSSPTADTVCQDMIFCGPYGQESFAFQVLDQAVNSGSIAAACSWPGWVYPFVLRATFWGYAVFWWYFCYHTYLHRPCLQPSGWRQMRFSFRLGL
ncbi:hypothetical protein N7485_003510 [Penicillium canescens]|nr:hypothetical protein N7485_003510 [Penicillium canescens]